MLATAGVGVALSLWLEYEHYRAHTASSAPSYCSIGERIDCTRVALSKYAVLLHLPIALWGILCFLAIGLASWERSRWLLILAAGSAFTSILLVLVSVLAIGAFCPVCALVHLDSLALLLLAWRSRRDELSGLRSLDLSLRVFGPPIGILIGLWLFFPRYWQAAFGWDADVPFAHGHTPSGDPWIGAAEPRLTLDEFVDYACPHCKAASARTLRRVAEYPEALRLVRRYFPLTPCAPRSEGRCLAMRIAYCADEQDRFWQTDRWLFGHDVLAPSIDVSRLAHDVGLDARRLADCVDQDRVFTRAADAWKQAKLLRIPGAPYYAINGRIMGQPDAVMNIENLK